MVPLLFLVLVVLGLLHGGGQPFVRFPSLFTLFTLFTVFTLFGSVFGSVFGWYFPCALPRVPVVVPTTTALFVVVFAPLSLSSFHWRVACQHRPIRRFVVGHWQTSKNKTRRRKNKKKQKQTRRKKQKNNQCPPPPPWLPLATLGYPTAAATVLYVPVGNGAMEPRWGVFHPTGLTQVLFPDFSW